MAEKNFAFDTGPLALALIVAALLFSGAFYLAPGKTVIEPSQNQQHMISVSSDASQEVSPDKVEITFSVVSRGEDASAIQLENDAKLRGIQEKLVALGVPASNIKTVGYSLDRWTEYNKTSESYDDRGYVLTNSLRVVSYDVTKAGQIVKEAVQNGANDVQGVQFGLSDASQKEVYARLLSQATAQAKQKAESMASAAGVRIVSLYSMSESYGYVEPMANSYRLDASAGGAPAPDVSISAGLVRVRASVGASYEVEG